MNRDDPIRCWSSDAAAELINLHMSGLVDVGRNGQPTSVVVFQRYQGVIANAMRETVRECLRKIMRSSVN